MALTYESRVGQILASMLEAEIARVTSDVIAGLMTPEMYRQSCGQITGYRESIALIDEAIAQANGKQTQIEDQRQ